jgi:XRE family transcriptional regulator, regulator of sulfur utilization
VQLGDRIRELRNNKGETLRNTSENTGLSVSYLSDIERGRTNPSLQTLETLANHFGITINDMLLGVDFAGNQTENAYPPGLLELFNDKELGKEIDEDWKNLLVKINLRGKRPQNKIQWMELYLSLKRILETRGE